MVNCLMRHPIFPLPKSEEGTPSDAFDELARMMAGETDTKVTPEATMPSPSGETSPADTVESQHRSKSDDQG